MGKWNDDPEHKGMFRLTDVLACQSGPVDFNLEFDVPVIHIPMSWDVKDIENIRTKNLPPHLSYWGHFFNHRLLPHHSPLTAKTGCYF